MKYCRKVFRKVRREFCQFIVGFDNCPVSYRRSFAKEAARFLVVCVSSILFLLTMILLMLSLA